MTFPTASGADEFGDHALFLSQLSDAGINSLPAEFVDRQALDDFCLSTIATNGKRRDQSRLNAVLAVRDAPYAEPIAGRGRVRQGDDATDCRIRRGGGRR